MSKLRTKLHAGQALVEFALVLPIMVVLLIGLADFGMLLYAQVQVTNAAREGARAGALYLGGRFHYTSCFSNCPAGYGDGGSNPGCWSLQAWVENGLAARNRDANGCPAAGFDTTDSVHAFGLLSPAYCPAVDTPGNCWRLDPAPLPFTPDPELDPSGMVLPLAGSELHVRVTYHYTPILLTALIGPDDNPIFDQDPFKISRTVIMKVQNN